MSRTLPRWQRDAASPAGADASAPPVRLRRDSGRWLLNSLIQTSIRQRNARALNRGDDPRHVYVARFHDYGHFSRRRSGHRGAGHEDAGYVRLHRLRIVNRLTIVAAQPDAELAEKRRI